MSITVTEKTVYRSEAKLEKNGIGTRVHTTRFFGPARTAVANAETRAVTRLHGEPPNADSVGRGRYDTSAADRKRRDSDNQGDSTYKRDCCYVAVNVPNPRNVR